MLLPENTRLGHVHLKISDLNKSLAFYEQVMGLRVQRRSRGTVFLGAGDGDLLALTEIPGVVSYPRRSGLYHFALLVPTRRDLGDFLRHLGEIETRVQGFADHLVSEAVYLADPNGNGIEIYRDRPRAEWEVQDEKIRMATEPFDLDGVITQSQSGTAWRGLPAGTVLGHMHLHVGDLHDASDFYQDVVGFEVTNADYPGARFLSAGGYHHHLGINTWNGVGAPPAPEDAVGLQHFSVLLPDHAAMAELKSRLLSAGVEIHAKDAGILLKDPSGNGILFEVLG